VKSRSLHVLAIKWFSLSIIVGIMVGLSTTAFIKILDLSINANQTGYLFLLPTGLFLNALIIYYFSVFPGTAGAPEKLLRMCNKTTEIMRNNSRFCCPCARRSGKLTATSPQGGDRLGLSQTRDAIAPRATNSKEIQHE